MTRRLFLCVVLIGLGMAYFSGVGFHFGTLGKALTALSTIGFLYYAGRTGWERFYLVVLTTLSSAVSLGCAFLNSAQATGPLVSSLRLSPFVIMLLSAALGSLAMVWYEKSKHKDKFAFILLSVFILNWTILAFNVHFFGDWKMENWLTVPFVIILYIMHRWFKLSNVSYGLLFAYMMLHIYGSHYTYAEVPFGFWMQDFFHMTRNHYDRIVHFSFGFLLAYPIRELIIRISNTEGFWAFWFPVEFVLAFSCVYELLEWLIAILFGGDLGIAYLGTQGDVWDAQQDMFIAGLGAVMAMSIVFVIVWYFRRSDFWRDMLDSLQVKQKRALGEEALREFKAGSKLKAVKGRP